MGDERGQQDSMRAPRYQGIPTFMRTPLVSEASEVDIALIGVPFDGGVSNRPGARHGPREIRNMSTMIRRVHQVTRMDPYQTCRVGDLGDVFMPHIFDLAATVQDLSDYYRSIHEKGTVPLSAGGDHSITFPILKGIAWDRPVGLIHIDAHTDTWDEFLGSKFMHGTPFRRAVEEHLVDPKRAIQIGIRGAQNTQEGWQFSVDSGMRVVFMDEFTRLGVEAIVKEARRIVGDGPAYLSFDIDGLDPAFAPGTGTPEVGGITTVEALTLLRGFRDLDLVGGDVVEVSPPFDPSGNTALVGATLMYEILCLLAESIRQRKKH